MAKRANRTQNLLLVNTQLRLILNEPLTLVSEHAGGFSCVDPLEYASVVVDRYIMVSAGHV